MTRLPSDIIVALVVGGVFLAAGLSLLALALWALLA